MKYYIWETIDNILSANVMVLRVKKILFLSKDRII